MYRKGWWKVYLKYRSSLRKIENHRLRINFLEECKKADIIPKFLKFRIPNNGCFEDQALREFQLKLLRKEIIKAKCDLENSKMNIFTVRNELKDLVGYKYLPYIILHSRLDLKELRFIQSSKLNTKLNRLSKEQDRPLFNVENTVIYYNLNYQPPKYVFETLALGPKNSILTKFHKNEVLAEVDKLLKFCKAKKISDEIMTDINVKTLTYIKNCNKQKNPRNIQMTCRYLKENKLVAIPFDKVIGVCLMTVDTYNNKLKDIINLP